MLIENFLPESFQDEIYKTVTDSFFPWYFLDDNNYSKGDPERLGVQMNDTKIYRSVGFFHMLFLDSKGPQSDYYNLFKPMLNFIEIKFQTKINSLHRMKLNLLTNNSTVIENGYHGPHTDWDQKHKTLIYYINDSDGDTVFFKSVSPNIVDYKLTPKKGSACLFDGSVFHSSNNPVNTDKRLVLNINFT